MNKLIDGLWSIVGFIIGLWLFGVACGMVNSVAEPVTNFAVQTAKMALE